MVILHRWVLSFICSFIRPPLLSPSTNKQSDPSNSSCSCHDSFSKHAGCPSSSRILVEEGISSSDLCCVCLSRLNDWGAVRALPCRHEFHKKCIERWFVGRIKTCPICRLRMDDAAVDGFCSVEEDGLTEEMIIWFSSFHAAGF